MKYGFIGACLATFGAAVLVVWAGAIVQDGIPDHWTSELLVGHLLAVGGWMLLIGYGVALLGRSIRGARVARSGANIRARSGVVAVLGMATASIGMTLVFCGAFTAVMFAGESGRASVAALFAPVAVGALTLAGVGGVVGRLWWPTIQADDESVAVASMFQTARYRRGEARFTSAKGSVFVEGAPRALMRSPLAFIGCSKGRSIHLSSMRLSQKDIDELNLGSASGGSWLVDPYIVVPPR